MKKSVSILYTVFVVVILLGVIAYYGWDIYQSRSERIADFESRTEGYTRRLAESLEGKRDVKAEVAIAEELMKSDPSLIAVQVYSHDDGLRLSVVKPSAGDFSRTSLAESDGFDGWISSLRYHRVSKPMRIEDMQGLEAIYVSTTLSGAEIRNNLLIILITVAGLFVITLLLILIRPGRDAAKVSDDDMNDMDHENHDDLDDFASPSSRSDIDDDGGFDIDLPDFDETDRLDDSDLLGSSPDFSETLLMEDDFSLPDLDDFSSLSIDEGAVPRSKMIERLDKELERAASFNQDLSLLLFNPGGASENQIRDSFNFEDLVFVLDDGKIAVIEINKDLDTVLSFTEDLVRSLIENLKNRRTRAGIASRNGRLISAERLFSEALGALNRTDGEKNIVAFRSDPEKYREYLRSQVD